MEWMISPMQHPSRAQSPLRGILIPQAQQNARSALIASLCWYMDVPVANPYRETHTKQNPVSSHIA